MKHIRQKLSGINLFIIFLSTLIASVYFVFYFLIGDYITMILSFIVIVFPVLLYILGKKIKINEIIRFWSIIFIFLSMVLGSIIDLYNIFPGYDKMVHFIFGLLFSALVIYIMVKNYRKISRLKLVLGVVFINFVVALLWELFEYSSDFILGTDAQKGTRDTTLDIIFAVVGGLSYAVIYFNKKKLKLKI